VVVGWVGRGEEGLERLRGSIGRVRTGAEILREVNAWMNSYHKRNLSWIRTVISMINAARRTVVGNDATSESAGVNTIHTMAASLRKYTIAISNYLSDPRTQACPNPTDEPFPPSRYSRPRSIPATKPIRIPCHPEYRGRMPNQQPSHTLHPSHSPLCQIQ
jgi:hypothetical protein